MHGPISKIRKNEVDNIFELIQMVIIKSISNNYITHRWVDMLRIWYGYYDSLKENNNILRKVLKKLNYNKKWKDTK